ncbi:hypothetical protein KHQ07_16035 [Pseudochrobactrum algeriensis]|uniref:hypothetical protein n=1 Tax=Pseudochrobactrum algeriensis TaxID=2834768 RepID=UPI001BD15C3C|nr:hypothetical protein [Pseudochrobactrum algeriensis]QVQ40100.1 hypothetical protein KHQ07_16035 [Pseudochrobactrum algeriensis]
MTADYITRDSQPDALDVMQKSSLRLPVLAGEPIRKVKLIGEVNIHVIFATTRYAGYCDQYCRGKFSRRFILPGDRVDVIITLATGMQPMRPFRF